MWCIFQECEGLRNIADNPHTPHHTHRVFFVSCVPIVQRVKPDLPKSPECEKELLFVNIQSLCTYVVVYLFVPAAYMYLYLIVDL